MNNLINNKCPKCLQSRHSDDNNISIKCFDCNVVYDMKNNNKEYSMIEWERKKLIRDMEKNEGHIFKGKKILCSIFDINIEYCPHCHGELIKVNNNTHLCPNSNKKLVFENNKWSEYM
jgi:hypothetical protein